MKHIFLMLALVATFSTPTFASHPNGTVYAQVNGLVCDFCARALEKVFGKEEAVESINVDLDSKVITIHMQAGQSMDDESITTLIKDSGYDVKEIRRDAS